jgi:transposase
VLLCDTHPRSHSYAVSSAKALRVTGSRKPYRTDLSDARWALIEPILSEWRTARAALALAISPPPQHDLREIVDAILYVNRAGIPWDLLPHDFPPHQTVYSYYAMWEKEGITKRIHDMLRGKVRREAGRDEQPTAAILDAQSVKTSANVPEKSQGIDAGKRIKGRKRHIATDVLGLILVLIVTAANVHDTVGGRELIDQVAATQPKVSKTWVDSGYKQSVIDRGKKRDITVEVVTKEPNQKGFIPQHKRWAVEDRHQRCRSSDDRCSWGVSWGGVGVGPASAGVVAGRVVA